MVEIPSNQRQLDNTITRIGGYLDLIPPLPQSTGGQDIEVLKLFDKPRKAYLKSLADVAIKHAEFGFDPTRATELALSHIDHLYSESDRLDLVLSLALANGEFGNDPADLLDSATNLAERQRDAGMFAKLGEAQARLGLEQTGFVKADKRLAERIEEYKVNPLGVGQVVLTCNIEEVVLSKLRAGRTLSAKQTIGRVPWEDWRELLDDRLKGAFEIAELINAQSTS